jgi:hypothetical protein
MSTDPVITRLAVANPFPSTVQAAVARHPLRPRRLALAVVLAVVVTVPAVAFAASVGGLFGFSTEGSSVATSDTPFSKISGLAQASSDLGFPSTLQLLASRDGINFYAARRADGHVCVAVDEAPGAPADKIVGCDLGNPSVSGTPAFPSPQRPIIDFSRFSQGTRLAGFAADGVSAVELVDDSGAVIATAPVSDNVYADVDAHDAGTAVEALDANGAVVYKRSFDQAP